MKQGEVTNVAFIDVETVSLANEDVVWEEAIILADVQVDDAAGPVLTVTEVWEAFVDVDPWALKGADPNSLLFSRFYERHPRYRLPFRDRGNGRRALAFAAGEDDGIEYGRFYGGDTPNHLVFHREAAAYETVRLLAGRTVVGAIPWFDVERLDKLTRAFGPPLAVHYHLLDVEALMAGHLAAVGSNALQCLPPYSSSALAEAVGVPKMEGAHEALPDAEWAMRCFARVYGTEIRGWPVALPDGWRYEAGTVDVAPPTGVFPVIYPGQPVQWDDGRSDQGLPIVRTGILRKHIPMTGHETRRWALVDVEYADGKRQPVHIRLDRLRHAAIRMRDTAGRRRGEPGFEDDYAGRARAALPPRIASPDVTTIHGTLIDADRASDDGFYNELRDHLTEPVIIGNSMTGHQYFDPAAPQHFDPGGAILDELTVSVSDETRAWVAADGWESLQDVMEFTGLDRDAAEALVNEVQPAARVAWEFPSTPVIYPGQQVTWSGPEDDEGKADTRTGVVRRVLPDDPLGPVAEILAAHAGGPVYVPLGSLNVTGRPIVDDPTMAEQLRLTQALRWATAGMYDAGMEVVHPTEEIDFGPGAHQEPPGDPSRNVVPAADELLAGKIEAALSTGDVHIDFDSGLERATIIGLIAGVVAEETAAATREAERWRAEHDQACETVAKMHEAAVGKVTGPRVGLVEDVRDLRDAYLQLKAADDRRRTPQPDWSAE